MSFETPNTLETPKSKQEIIDAKMNESEKLQLEIDNLIDRMPEGELKTSLQTKIDAKKKIDAEIVELIEKSE